MRPSPFTIFPVSVVVKGPPVVTGITPTKPPSVVVIDVIPNPPFPLLATVFPAFSALCMTSCGMGSPASWHARMNSESRRSGSGLVLLSHLVSTQEKISLSRSVPDKLHMPDSSVRSFLVHIREPLAASTHK